MSEKEELENEILRLEARKLDAEIRQIEAQLTSRKGDSRREGLKIWAAVSVAVVTLTSGILAVWTSMEQRQRQYEHSIGPTMIQLVQDLGSSEPTVRDNAAILLSAYEQDAIPLLLANLERAAEPGPIVESLRLISGKKRVTASQVLNPLVKATEEALAEGYSKPDDRSVQHLKNYFVALGALGELDSDETLGSLRQLKEDFEERSPPPSTPDRILIKKWANDACREIHNADCSP